MNVRLVLPRLLVAVAALVPMAGVPAAPVAAQNGGCGGGSGISRATVNIESPRQGGTVTGSSVAVTGTAESTIVVGSINRVEITFGGVTRVRTYENSASVRFDVPFDTREMSPGPQAVSVVACGLLQWGSDRVDVTVEGPPASTTTTLVTRTTLLTAPGATVVGNSSTTAATPTTRAGQTAASTPSGTTAGSSVPPTTAADPVPTSAPSGAVTGVSQPARPAGASDAPLVLTETPDRDSPRPPLWVGAVVGISGGLGLLFSAASWRRRGGGGEPDAPEPVDPDLIEVG